jgi:ribosomal protein L10
MKTKKQNIIPKWKLNTVKELSDLIKNKRTILITSIKNIPGSQFQEIVKKLRGKAIVKVPKKNLIFRAIDSSGNEEVKKLKEQFQEDVAILFSDLDCFELALDLEKSKSPAKAKAGQEAPEDIEIGEGPTDLVPGPAISELGALGIQIQIQKGKIHIKETKIIVGKGKKISAGAADIMNKLNIRPFSIGFVSLSAFDTKEGKLYLEIKIDKEGTLQELKSAYSKAFSFAVEIGYATKDTIKFLIGKAGVHERILEKLELVDDKGEIKGEEIGVNSEDKIKEKIEEKQNNQLKEEVKNE